MLTRTSTIFCLLVLHGANGFPQGRTCPEICVSALYDCGNSLGEKPKQAVSRSFENLTKAHKLDSSFLAPLSLSILE